MKNAQRATRATEGSRSDLQRTCNQVIAKLKSVVKLPDAATAQTLSYLKATGLKRALLPNFGEKRRVDGLKRLSL